MECGWILDMSLAIILAIVVAIGTVLLALLMLFADSMSDAPSVDGISPIPTLITGFIIAGLLAGSHYIHVPW